MGTFLLKCKSVLVTQSCLTICDPKDCSPSGSSVHGILQARILEWVTIIFSRGYSPPGVEPGLSALQTNSLPHETQGSPVPSHHFPSTLYWNNKLMQKDKKGGGAVIHIGKEKTVFIYK